MKGGVAVMVELAAGPRTAAHLARPRRFSSSCARSCRRGERLPRVFAEAPLVLESGLVVVLEPTDNAIHAGCLGNLNATASSAARAPTPPGPGRA
jgi:hypothetical protein